MYALLSERPACCTHAQLHMHIHPLSFSAHKSIPSALLPPRSNPPNKVQEMLERPTPLTSPTIVNVMRGLNLGVEHAYLDPSQFNEAGAGYFVYGPPGAEQSVLVMVRGLVVGWKLAAVGQTVSSVAGC